MDQGNKHYIKQVEDNTEDTAREKHRQISLNRSKKHRGLKQKQKGSHIKVRQFCIENETLNKVKQQPTEWEKMLVNYTTDRRLTFRI